MGSRPPPLAPLRLLVLLLLVAPGARAAGYKVRGGGLREPRWTQEEGARATPMGGCDHDHGCRLEGFANLSVRPDCVLCPAGLGTPVPARLWLLGAAGLDFACTLSV